MRIDVVTLMPEFVTGITGWGVTGRALRAGMVELRTWNPRDYSTDRHRTVDDRPYGGGPGMVMQAGPLSAAVRAAREADPRGSRTLLLSPQGRRLDQAALRELADLERMILVAGRYEGVDQRFVDAEIDAEISIGDYVLSGGELAAMVLIDGVTRLQPGALGDAQSASQDSFSESLLEYPHYTRPEVVDGRRVPAVLLSGDHEAIRRWRRREALGRTWLRRPDLLERLELDEQDASQLDDYKREHAAGDGHHVAGESNE